MRPALRGGSGGTLMGCISKQPDAGPFVLRNERFGADMSPCKLSSPCLTVRSLFLEADAVRAALQQRGDPYGLPCHKHLDHS